MKSWILLLFLCHPGILIKLFSQSYFPLPNSDSFWSVNEFDEAKLTYDDLIYTVTGDTLINELSYSKVYQLNENASIYDTIRTLHCFMRQDESEKKVFFIRHYLGETDEKLGYDFSTGIGDTICLPAFDYGNVGDSLFIREKGYCDSIQIHTGEYRKMYFYSSSYSAFGHTIIFIEGIGEYYSTFPNRRYEYDAFHPTQGVCVEQNQQFVWSWFSPPDSSRCGFNFLGSGEISEKLQFIAYPNPANVYTRIRIPYALTKGVIQMLNLEGNVLMHQSIEPCKTEYILDLSKQVPGIYLLCLENQDSRFFHKLYIIK